MYIGPDRRARARAAEHHAATFDVVVVGLGYIGLPTAAVIAQTGKRVLGIDVTAAVVNTINSGRIHIEEVALEALVRGVVDRGLLSAALTPLPAKTFLIAVPTPFHEDRQPDISYVLAAARAIAPVLKPHDLVILESTSPVGTTRKVAQLLAELRPDLSVPLDADSADTDLYLAYCPERVLPGQIVRELVENDRVVGGLTPRCTERALAFYRTFVTGACLPATAHEAEMVKLVENSYRDVNIAFANEISMIADGMGIDVRQVIGLANRHPRVDILSPGPGVGGHCIAVDPWFLVAGDPANSRLIRTAREVNDAKTDYVVARAAELIEARPEAQVACLGLAFKANIDDFRASPALAAAAALARRFGPRVKVVEPYAGALPAAFDGTGATLVALDEALATCGILFVLVDHAAFRAVPLDRRRDHLVYDTRGLWPDQPRRTA